MIKKKSGWSIYSKPQKPILRSQPVKTITKTIEIAAGYSFTGAEIESYIPKNYLDQGYSFKNLDFRSSSTYDDSSEVIVELNIQFPNDKYEEELVKFEKQKETHKIKLKAWKEEIKLWEAWKIQEENNNLQIQLKQAENLLKKHNKI